MRPSGRAFKHCAAPFRDPDRMCVASRAQIAGVCVQHRRPHLLFTMIVRACMRLAIQRLTFTHAMLFTNAKLHLQTRRKYRGSVSFHRLAASHRVVLIVPRKPWHYKNRFTMENTSRQPCVQRLEAKYPVAGSVADAPCVADRIAPNWTAAFFDYV
jgi:hypothetical protein